MIRHLACAPESDEYQFSQSFIDSKNGKMKLIQRSLFQGNNCDLTDNAGRTDPATDYLKAVYRQHARGHARTI